MPSRFRDLLVPLALFAGFAAGSDSGAVTVSGQVVDELGTGVFNVDLDFFDLDLDELIFTLNDNTDFGGFYSVDVPVGNYEITYTPPAGSPNLPHVIDQISITGATVLNVTLPGAHAVSGHVQATTGGAIANVNLDFVDLSTGDEYDASGDNTDATGDFSVLVPSATYDISFTPKLGDPFAGTILPGVNVAAPMSLGTIVLQPGLFVSAHVVGPTMSPVANADLDFLDQATSETIFSPRDNTDALGNVNVPIPAATYDVIFKPQPASGLAWKTMFDVAVVANTNLGTVQLETGLALTGIVRDDSGQPVVNADLDMVEVATGNELPTRNDNTDSSGGFSLLTAATTLDLVIQPPAGAALAAGIVRDVTVSGPLNLGVITLFAGFPVSGTVRDASGTPVEGADLDAFQMPFGVQYPTFGDDTDVAGDYAIRLPAGSYELVATPPEGSGLLPATMTVGPLSGPATVDFVLSSGGVGVEGLDGSGQRPGLALHPSAPNPFRASTRVVFDLPAATPGVRLSIFDLAGRAVREIVSGDLGAGRHAASWDGRDESGTRVASGMYFYRLQAGATEVTRRVTVLR